MSLLYTLYTTEVALVTCLNIAVQKAKRDTTPEVSALPSLLSFENLVNNLEKNNVSTVAGD